MGNTTKSIDDLLDSADFPQRIVSLCLKGSLRARWETAQDKLEQVTEEIEATRSTTTGKVTAAAGKVRERRQLAEEVTAVEQEMTDHTIDFTVAGFAFAEFNALLLKHPPRKENTLDAMFGFNTGTFHPAHVKACLVDPTLTQEQWDKLVSKLTDRQFDDLASAAMEVNRRQDGSVPFSRSASEAMRESAGTSDSPETSG